MNFFAQLDKEDDGGREDLDVSLESKSGPFFFSQLRTYGFIDLLYGDGLLRCKSLVILMNVQENS